MRNDPFVDSFLRDTDRGTVSNKKNGFIRSWRNDPDEQSGSAPRLFLHLHGMCLCLLIRQYKECARRELLLQVVGHDSSIDYEFNMPACFGLDIVSVVPNDVLVANATK